MDVNGRVCRFRLFLIDGAGVESGRLKSSRRCFGYSLIMRTMGLLLLLLWHGVSAVAGTSSLTLPPYKQYTKQDGLPQMQVQSVFQDSRGYLWAGTKRGVARYNGERFESFHAKEGFIFNQVDRMMETPQGEMWFMATNGLASYQGGQFKCYPSPSLRLQRCCLGGEDTLYFAARSFFDLTSSVGFFYKGEYHVFDIDFDADSAMWFYDIAYDIVRRTIYLSSTMGVFAYKGEGRLIPIIEASKEGAYFLLRKYGEEVYLVEFFSDRQESIFYRLREDSKEVVAHYREGVAVIPTAYKEITEDLFLIFQGTTECCFFDRGQIVNRHLEHNLIFSAVNDQDGTTWLGTEKGVFKQLPEAFVNYDYHQLPDVWAVFEYPQGRYWMSSYHNGLKSVEQNVVKKQVSSLSTPMLYSFRISSDYRGTLYFPMAYGIQKKRVGDPRAKDQRLILYRPNDDNTCLTTFYDPLRRTLLGGFRNRVALFDDAGTLIGMIPRDTAEQFKSYVLSLGQDSLYNYWIGGKGLYYYDCASEQLTEYATTMGDLKIFSSFCDETGRTWFGSSVGLLYCDHGSDQVVRVESEELKEEVFMVTGIDTSSILCSQPHGLYRLDKRRYFESGEVLLTLYNEQNGYLGMEPEQDGAFRDSNGDIWITGTALLSRLIPDKLEDKTTHANLLFLSYNHVAIPYGTEQIKLPKNEHSTIIRFDAICFNRPIGIEYRYRLSSDTTWHAWQKESFVVLHDLPHGTTTLSLQMRSPGVVNLIQREETYPLEIVVNHLFYNQAWFIPLVIALLIGLVLFALFLNYRMQMKLVETNRKSMILEMDTIMSQINPHFIFNVLASIQAKIFRSDIQTANDYLIKLAQLIRGFVHSPIGSTSTDKKGTSVADKMVPLSDELELVSQFVDFQQFLNKDRFVYELVMDEEIDPEQVLIPPMLLQPFVENAIIHGLLPMKEDGRKLRLLVKNHEGHVSIVIVDNGIGIKKSHSRRRKSILRYASSGRKLTIKRIRLFNKLGWPIEVETFSSEKGTTIIVELYNQKINSFAGSRESGSDDLRTNN